MAASLLACGLDPKKCLLFQQSRVFQHTELSWILGCNCTVPTLSRLSQYKEKSEKLKVNYWQMINWIVKYNQIVITKWNFSFLNSEILFDKITNFFICFYAFFKSDFIVFPLGSSTGPVYLPCFTSSRHLALQGNQVEFKLNKILRAISNTVTVHVKDAWLSDISKYSQGLKT